MQFNKLRLTGFKSFVNGTDLDIAPGLTGIVGPNGCGKSNLVEALRWVMGETSAKQMRGGGIVFGPQTRDHSHELPKKVRKLALATALSAKQAEGKLVILDEAKLSAPKTADLVKKLTALGWGHTLVIDGDSIDENFARAANNIVGIDVLLSAGANVYDILRRDTLVLTKGAVEKLMERLK